MLTLLFFLIQVCFTVTLLIGVIFFIGASTVVYSIKKKISMKA